MYLFRYICCVYLKTVELWPTMQCQELTLKYFLHYFYHCYYLKDKKLERNLKKMIKMTPPSGTQVLNN